MNGNRTTLFLCGIIVAFVAALFHLLGVTDSGYDPATTTHSLFVWLSRRWVSYSATQDDFPYGWAAPLVSLWMVWRLRRELSVAAKRVNYAGLALIVVALVLHWIGARTQQTRISFAAFLLLVWSVPYYLCGWRVARLLLVPAGFLVFMIQLDFLSGLALKFRQVQGDAAVMLLNGLGFGEMRIGRMEMIAAPGCGASNGPGGLRSLFLVGAVAVVLAWLRQRGILRQFLLLASVPLVVFCASVLRIITIIFLFQHFFIELQQTESRWVNAGFYLAAFSLLYAWHRFLRAPRSPRRANVVPQEDEP